MAEYKFPGVYVQEISTGMHAIEGVPTTNAAFVGFAESGPLTPIAVSSFNEYQAVFGGFLSNSYLPHAVHGFFQNGGVRCYVLRVAPQAPVINLPKPPLAPGASVKAAGAAAAKLTAAAPIDSPAVLTALDAIIDVSLVCCPDEHSIPGIATALVAHSELHRDRIAILAAPLGSDLSAVPPREVQSSFAAYYAPWVMVANPAGDAAIAVHPGGHIAGAIVVNDRQRGIHKAPANIPVVGIVGLERAITEPQQSELNPRGVNELRNFPGRGVLVWGARTTSTDPEWKYINVRRYLNYLERSIEKGTQWAVFEPNGEELWSNVRRTINDFLLNQWQSGGLLGVKPEEAYFVQCDRTTMTQDDINNCRLICQVGVAPVKPAEFVVFRIGQWTADRKC